VNKKKRDKLMESANKILDEYNDGKLTKGLLATCMKPVSLGLQVEMKHLKGDR